jgi:hypothetical protein
MELHREIYEHKNTTYSIMFTYGHLLSQCIENLSYSATNVMQCKLEL